MSIDMILNYTRFSPTTITEEQYTDVGTTFTLGTHKRAFLASSFVLTRTEGGAPLTRGVDYELTEKDVFYSQAAYENEDVFTKVNILNSSYETGDLFATYDAVLTYATTEAVRSIGLPAGAIIAYGSTVAPSGYLLCDGAAVSRTTYADLFTAISTTWGVGDGSTTFNLPDGRGGVLRGAGTGSVNGRDKVGPAVGDKQEDQMQRITGDFTASRNAGGELRGFVNPSDAGSAFVGAFKEGRTGIGGVTESSTNNNNRGVAFDSANSPGARVPTEAQIADPADTETRAYSIGVQFIIKT